MIFYVIISYHKISILKFTICVNLKEGIYKMENKISKDETSINKITEKTKLQKEKKVCEKKFTTTEIICLVVLSLIIGVAIGGLFGKTSIITKKSVLSDEYLKRFAETYQNILSNYF